MATAEVLGDTLVVSEPEEFTQGQQSWWHVYAQMPEASQEAYEAMPSAIQIDGRVYGKSGWSESGRCSYNTWQQVAATI